MKRFLVFFALFVANGFLIVPKEQDVSAVNAVDKETAQLRIFAKYAAVFRLLPARISQMLAVVNAYPASNPERRLDLLQIAIQRLHEKYRTQQQLHDRVLELQAQADPGRRAGVYARCSVLLVSIKKYQITLVSILSVLDAEFVRFAKAVHEQKGPHSTKTDAAFLAAKSSLNPTKMDLLISMLVAGPSSPAETESVSSVAQEIRQLRDEVAQLNAQIQVKALTESANTSRSREFADDMQRLAQESSRAAMKAKSDFGALIDTTIESGAPAGNMLSKARRIPSKTLQGRALAFHAQLTEFFSRSYQWGKEQVAQLGRSIVAGWCWVMSLPVIRTIHDSLLNVGGQVFNDTQKAAKHVEHRMKEVKEATPGGISLLKESFCGFMDWIVESWIRVGQYMLSFMGGVTDGWHVVHEKAQRFDDGMREFACRVCDWGVQAWHSTVDLGARMKARVMGQPVASTVEVGTAQDIEKDLQSESRSVGERLVTGLGQVTAACRVGMQSTVDAVMSWREKIWPSVRPEEGHHVSKQVDEEKVHLPSWTEQLYELKTMAATRLRECVAQVEVLAGKARDKLYTLTGRASVPAQELEEKK